MRKVALVVLGVVSAVVLGIATNVATDSWPQWARPYLWLAWPVLIVCALALGVLQLLQVGDGSAPTTSGQARAVLLNRVRRYAVEGILHHSLYQEARIELGMEADVRPQHPWDMVASHANGNRAIAPGTPISSIFDDLDHAMLIVGEPGAGKTTMLLELTQQMLDRALGDPDQPVPVYLQLSRWALRRQPMAEWVVAEMSSQYGIPRPEALGMLRSNRIALLLDGLDEVAAEHRNGAVASVNALHREHTLIAIAVCCRAEEFAEAGHALMLYGKLTIRPLSVEQIADFLNRAGASAGGLRRALAEDPQLREMAVSPLMLSIMWLAFRDGPDRAPAPVDRPENRVQALFAAYVDTMLKHRRSPRYDDSSTLRWLTHLARMLAGGHQTVFRIDDIEHSWLGDAGRPPRRMPRILLSALVIAVLAGAGYALIGLAGVGVAGLVGVLIYIAFDKGVFDELSYLAVQSRRSPNSGRPAASRADYLSGFLVGPIAQFPENDVVLYVSVAVGSAVGFICGVQDGVAVGCAAAVAVFLTGLLAFGWLENVLIHRDTPASAGNDGSDRRAELPSPTLIFRLRVVIAAAPLGGIAAGVITGLIVGWPASREYAIRFGLLVGLAITLFLLLLVYVINFAEQYLVRRRLSRAGLVPLPYLPFLDYAVHCLFLRKSGANYIFIHRELLDYFAAR